MPPVVLLIVAGLQVPVIAFGDVAPKVGAGVPEQKAGIAAKLGTVCAFIVTLAVAVTTEQLPLAGMV